MSEKVGIQELQNVIKSLYSNYITKLTYLYISKLLNNKVEIEGIGYKIDKRFNEVVKATGFETFEIFRDCIFPDSKDIKSIKISIIEKGDIKIFTYIYELKTMIFNKLYRVVYEVWKNENCVLLLVHDFGIF